MASEISKPGMNHLERLTKEFVIELSGSNEYGIECSWRELKSYVDQLKTLNIHYAWQRYELAERLYTKWKMERQNRTPGNI